MNYKIVLLALVFVLSVCLVNGQPNCEDVCGTLCTVNNNCWALSCYVLSAPNVLIDGAPNCGDCLGHLTKTSQWTCTKITAGPSFIVPEFGLVPKLITFLSSLGIPLWLFKRRK
ncbi:MAG: hypothetical protein KKH40_07010 [Nanoarchaeota archaeon]|nr:hypothetical protein [Nanoarchaeota archaeon]